MNRTAFLRTLAGGMVALPALSTAETPVEAAIYDLLDAAIDAQFACDFPKLAAMLHPASLRGFRSHLSARFDQLLRHYSLGQVVSASGLPMHPKDMVVADAEVFITACNSARERHPDFACNPKVLPFRIHGTIFDNDRLAHVLFSHADAIQTERTDFKYVEPGIFTVKRDQDTWQVYSCLLARRIADDWWRDLASSKG